MVPSPGEHSSVLGIKAFLTHVLLGSLPHALGINIPRTCATDFNRTPCAVRSRDVQGLSPPMIWQKCGASRPPCVYNKGHMQAILCFKPGSTRLSTVSSEELIGEVDHAWQLL